MPREQEVLQGILDLLRQNRGAEALAAIENSRPGDPFRSSFDYAKAMVFCSMGQRREGVDVLTRLLAREPDFLDAKKLLDQLVSEGWSPVEAADKPQSRSPDYYGKSRLNPSTLAAIATSPATWKEILGFHGSLATDAYVTYVDSFYRENLARFGENWRYLDAINVLYAASKSLRPARYLEIGVRRGRSVSAVARGCPDVDVFAFDMWIAGYAGMDNPGPGFVREELRRNGHRGRVEFFDGDSHTTLPRFFREHPGLQLDLITVDGDHSENGAAQDLDDVIPRLAEGGVLVMDDIAHPAHPYLLKVWREAVARHPGLVTHEFAEQGYGVAFAIKKA